MAFAFVASTTSDTSTGTSITINKPTGTVDDDLMFAFLYSNTALTNSVPSGWTLAGNNNTAGAICALYYKKASSEGASYNWGWAGSQAKKVIIVTYRGGFNLTTPIDVVSNASYTTNNTTLRADTMTVTKANSPLIFFGGVDTGSSTTSTPPTVPTTFAEDYDNWNTTPQKLMTVASVVWTGSGATGNIDATISASNTGKHAFAVALNPNSYSIVADQGSYALNGQDVNFLRTYIMSLTHGAFTLTGQAVGLLYGRIMSLAVGLFSLIGFDVDLSLLWNPDSKPSDTSYNSDSKPTSSWTNDLEP